MSVYEKLYSWQKNIVDKFYDKKSFGLFLDMGLGKTPTTLAFAEQHHCSKILVISINAKAQEDESVKGSWLWWASQMTNHYEFKTKKSIDFDNKCNELMIVNYEALFERGNHRNQRVVVKSNIEKFIQSCKNCNCAIIVDESHKMKNLQSLQTIAITKIKKELEMISNNTYTYLLTGTPFTTGYIDLYSQLKILGCELNKGQFVDEFCVRGNIPGLLGWQQPIVGYKNTESLFNLLHKYAITIKSDDVIQLPEKVFVYHDLKMSQDMLMYVKDKATTKEINDTFARHNLKMKIDEESKKVVNPFFRNIAYPNLKWIAETSGTHWLRARQLSIGFQGNAEESVWYDKRRLQLLEKFLSENEDNYLLFYKT